MQPADLKDHPRRRGWASCMLVGGFAAAAMVMLALIAFAFVAPRYADHLVQKYTGDRPAVVAVDIPEMEREEVEIRAEAFVDAVDARAATEPLALTDRDLNALAATDDDDVRAGNFRVRDGRVTAEVSVRLDGTFHIGPVVQDVTGRYLNGTAAFRVVLDGNSLDVHVESVRVKDSEIPGWAVDVLERELNGADWLNEPDTKRFLDGLEAIRVEDGRITLIPKQF